MQTEFRLLARLTYCGRNANYCVMRMTECPDGRQLRITSSLATTGFQEMRPVSSALASEGRRVTGIKRADTANEIQFSPAKSNDIFDCDVCGRTR